MPDSDFFKNDGHYCAQCVGNKDSHAPGCTVPEQIEAQKESKEMGEKQ